MSEVNLHERCIIEKKLRVPVRHTIAGSFRMLKLLFAFTAVSLMLVATPVIAAQKTLYERLGGIYPIATTVDDLVGRLYVNGTLNANPAVKAVHDRGGQAGFKVLVTAWVVEKTGGPKMYPGLPLDKAHAHLNITDREFDVVMNECATTFYKFNVPEREFNELMALLESYRSQVVTSKNVSESDKAKH